MGVYVQEKKQYKSDTIMVSGICCAGILKCIPMVKEGLTIHFHMDIKFLLLLEYLH